MYKKIKTLYSESNFLITTNHVVCWEKNGNQGKITFFKKSDFKEYAEKKVIEGLSIEKKDEERVWAITPAFTNEYYLNGEKSVYEIEKVYEGFTPCFFNSEEELVVGTTLALDFGIGDVRGMSKNGSIWSLKIDSINFYSHKNSFLINHPQEMRTFYNYQLSKVDIKTGEILWRKDIRDYCPDEIDEEKKSKASVTKFLGYLNGKFYLALNVRSTIEIDFATGEMTRRWYRKKEAPTHSTGGNLCLLANENKIAGVWNRDYWEIDLITSEIRSESLFELFYEQHIMATRVEQLVFKGEHVIFNSEARVSYDKMSNQIVALNRKTLQIDWKYRFKEDGYGAYLRALKADENHLYVLDNVHKLHIFKKEK